MKHLIFAQQPQQESTSFLASEQLAQAFLASTDAELASYEFRNFPDGESYLRVTSDCSNKKVVILANLHQPNSKILPLIYLCEVLKEMACHSITLVCPYLPYMRQDIQFQTGEAVTSRFFAKLISQYVDHLITIDPHLHRYHSLSQIYACQTTVLQAHPVIVDWIKKNIENPFIVGPDSESEQWAANAAEMIGCPYLILEKQRFGDKDVSVSTKNENTFKGLTPVLIDDIISTGQTMIKTAEWLEKEGLCPPVCIGVHALFSGNALRDMQQANIEKTLTCSTISHVSNEIDISTLLVESIITS